MPLPLQSDTKFDIHLLKLFIVLAPADFFNWNKVKIRYCDGSSFSSHPDSELKVSHLEVTFNIIVMLVHFSTMPMQSNKMILL